MVLTKNQIDTIDLLVKILASISVAITIATLYVYFRNPSKAKFTSTLVVNLIICNLLNCASFLLPSENNTCCEIQSFFITIFTMGIYGWGFCNSVFLWLNLKYEDCVISQKNYIEVFFYLFSYGFPLAVALL